MKMPAWQIAIVGVVLGSTGSAQVTQRVSVATGGTQANGYSGLDNLSISADGRYVAFASFASNLVPGDTNGCSDIFVRDRRLGLTERVSVDSAGVQGDGESGFCSISADGRYVVFISHATNLVAGDTNGEEDIFLHDRQLGTTERMSIAWDGSQADLYPFPTTPVVSGQGRYVAFFSWAMNLVPGDTNISGDVFLRDRMTGTIERVSIDSNGMQGDGNSGFWGLAISPDGRFVAFTSEATNLVPGDTNGVWDVFVRDRTTGTTARVSIDSSGLEGNGHSYFPSISADGRFVAFISLATNLVPGDTNGTWDAFVHDRQSGATERVSVDSSGSEANAESDAALISGDGRYVAFPSFATNLVPHDTTGFPAWDVFVHDRRSGMTERVSVDSAGLEARGSSSDPSITADGRYVAFYSGASNLVPDDTNGFWDIFVRDRFGGTSFKSLCDPGVGSVIGCPCSNAPSGPGRGCDNSSGSGGAVLSASGGTFLSSDSLVFTTRDEKPTSLSILTQWTGTNSAGAVFGMGVRCTSGTFRRLYTKQAVAGSITAPDFGVSDDQVSVRSAALGDVILAGQARSYLVLYRDPTVLGSCPAPSTFNATQTGQVSWWP